MYAVSLLEDDEFWNCGRGSVFNLAGTIEMEASVMVTSVHKNSEHEQQKMKQGVSVIGLKNVRNPIRLARESLLRTGIDANGEPNDDGGSMHPQLVAPYIEDKAREWGLEFKPDEWFWTQKRWDEHRRGLKGEREQEPTSLSQGTVGCVCLDQLREFGHRNQYGRDDEQVAGADWGYTNFGSWVLGRVLGCCCSFESVVKGYQCYFFCLGSGSRCLAFVGELRASLYAINKANARSPTAIS